VAVVNDRRVTGRARVPENKSSPCSIKESRYVGRIVDDADTGNRQSLKSAAKTKEVRRCPSVEQDFADGAGAAVRGERDRCRV
jgi:hypothetical protein